MPVTHRQHRQQPQEGAVGLVGFRTRISDLPSRALPPTLATRPPITMVGSRPAWSSSTAVIEVVVVLPCDPATATANFIRISSASISARGMIGRWSFRAAASSGLSAGTAEEMTTTSADSTCSAACPSNTMAPSSARRPAFGPKRRSEPLTG